jgi:hypothetical protein
VLCPWSLFHAFTFRFVSTTYGPQKITFNLSLSFLTGHPFMLHCIDGHRIFIFWSHVLFPFSWSKIHWSCLISFVSFKDISTHQVDIIVFCLESCFLCISCIKSTSGFSVNTVDWLWDNLYISLFCPNDSSYDSIAFIKHTSGFSQHCFYSVLHVQFLCFHNKILCAA